MNSAQSEVKFSVEKIKVLLVEDELNWQTVMKGLLRNEIDIIIVGTAMNRETAIKAVKENEIDVILMDINLSGNKCDGIYIAAEISQFSTAKIIMLTSLNEEEIIIDSFKAGAVNFILKEKYKEIPAIIRSTYNATTPMELLLKDYLRLKKEEQLKELTNAEKEIFGLIEEGYTQKQIQDKLYKSESTLKSQISQVLKKLGVKSSKEAVKKVKTRGLFNRGRN
jgi:DNA-binding NarL/FixJ family response regulator